VARLPEAWALAAAGGSVVIGARVAAWAPVADPGAVVVLDEHDEAHQEERSPTWHARDVAVERAARGGVPCLLVSPCPTLEALEAAGERVWAPARADERAGWAVLEVVDRTGEEPGRQGLVSERVVPHLRGERRVVCVLNRTGRARLLACASCGRLAECEQCGAAVGQPTAPPSGVAGLVCPRCGSERPMVCAACGGARLKNLRIGVSRAREELEALARRPVAEVTAATDGVPPARVLVGTEAVLHRVAAADTVVFLDFDGEVLAPRYRAAEQALALLARAARLVGGRAGRVVVQTRLPRHDVVQAALLADPGRLTDGERGRRSGLRFPPFVALAQLSGAGADALAEQLRVPGGADGVEVLGPPGGPYLVRAPDHAAMAAALRRAGRPPGRIRVEVDPLRV
jgi:primosomal protein N' (replication factor Y)